MEDLWKAAFSVDTEMAQLDSLNEYNWDFSNLKNAFEEAGVLHGKNVYLFGCTEPQFVPFMGVCKALHVPAVVLVVSTVPPSDKIVIKSVQREAEEIIPMKEMMMDWVPYIPLENRDNQVDTLNSQIFILGCTKGGVALRHSMLDRGEKFKYCLPYFYELYKEDEREQSTEVQIMYPLEPPVFCDFDWDLDEIEEFTDKLIKEEALPREEEDNFKEFVKEKVLVAKSANRQARESKKRALEEMSEESRKIFENMRFYKFYPVRTPDTPDISQVKAHYINRYCCKGHEIL